MIDVGVAYNSNVQLAPILRDALTTGTHGTQFFLSPQIETSLFPNSAWNAGFSLKGYFSFNESQLQEFNVDEYQPGTFVERSMVYGDRDIVLRAQYDFILDQFQGATFGRRHATTCSLNVDSPRGHSLVYWTFDYSDFTDDGIEPNQTSLDGWTHTLARAIHSFGTRQSCRS